MREASWAGGMGMDDPWWMVGAVMLFDWDIVKLQMVLSHNFCSEWGRSAFCVRMMD
jgi:hypothetical protein